MRRSRSSRRRCETRSAGPGDRAPVLDHQPAPATRSWRSSIEEFLDLKKFIRHLAIENFLAEEDGLTGDYGPNNFYFYRFVNTNLLHVPAVGQEQHVLGEPVSLLDPPQHRGRRRRPNATAWCVRALKDPDLRELWLEHAPRVRELRSMQADAGDGARPTARLARSARSQRGSDSRRGRYADPREVYYERGLRGRVDPIPDELGAQTRSDRSRAGRRRPRQTRAGAGR